MVVMIAASTSFASPIGYATNLIAGILVPFSAQPPR